MAVLFHPPLTEAAAPLAEPLYPPLIDDQSEELWALDVGLGLVAYVLAFGFRRRWPVPVALVVSLLAGGSAIASGPNSVVNSPVAG